MPRRPDPRYGIEYPVDRVQHDLLNAWDSLSSSEHHTWDYQEIFPDHHGYLGFMLANRQQFLIGEGFYISAPLIYDQRNGTITDGSILACGQNARIELSIDNSDDSFLIGVKAAVLGPFGYGPWSLRSLTFSRSRNLLRIDVPFPKPTLRAFWVTSYGPQGSIGNPFDLGLLQTR